MKNQKLATAVRQEQIRKTALELLSSRGMKGLKMAGVAQELGLVPSAIYRHFKSKGEVLDAVLDLLQARLMTSVRAVREGEGGSLEQLEHLLRLHLQLILGHRALPMVLFSEDIYGGHPERKARLYEIIKRYLEEVATIVVLGQQRNEIKRGLSPATISVLFLGMIQPSVILWHLSDGGFDLVEHMEKAWPIFHEAIRAI